MMFSPTPHPIQSPDAIHIERAPPYDDPATVTYRLSGFPTPFRTLLPTVIYARDASLVWVFLAFSVHLSFSREQSKGPPRGEFRLGFN